MKNYKNETQIFYGSEILLNKVNSTGEAEDIISGEKTVEQMGEEVLEYIIQLASGEINTKAMDLGQDDFMFWRRGVSL